MMRTNKNLQIKIVKTPPHDTRKLEPLNNNSIVSSLQEVNNEVVAKLEEG